MSTSSVKKTSILLSFDNKALLELRRTLFPKGLSPQEFFTYIVEQLVIRDERLDLLVTECSATKNEKLKKGEVNKKHLDANSLYEAIEAELESRKEEKNDLFEKD